MFSWWNRYFVWVDDLLFSDNVEREIKTNSIGVLRGTAPKTKIKHVLCAASTVINTCKKTYKIYKSIRGIL